MTRILLCSVSLPHRVHAQPLKTLNVEDQGAHTLLMSVCFIALALNMILVISQTWFW